MSIMENSTARYHYYIYHGPVWNTFNNLIEERWYCETLAPSKEKALSNLKWKFKGEREAFPYSRIYLDPHRLSIADFPIRIKDDAFKVVDESKDEECQTCCQLKLF